MDEEDPELYERVWGEPPPEFVSEDDYAEMESGPLSLAPAPLSDQLVPSNDSRLHSDLVSGFSKLAAQLTIQMGELQKEVEARLDEHQAVLSQMLDLMESVAASLNRIASASPSSRFRFGKSDSA